MSTEGIDATEAAIVASMLASDNVPDANQAGHCFSCDAPMKGLFCSECGQKNDNYRRSIFALVRELFGSVFSLESRIWRSWGALLFMPGKVPREYSDGRRTHWSSPVRVYLAMSIILFGFMSFSNTHLLSVDADARVKDGIEKPIEALTKQDIQINWDIHFFETQKSIDLRNKDRDFRLLAICFADDGSSPTIDFSDIENNVEFGILPDDDTSGCGGLDITFSDGKSLSKEQSGTLMTNFIRNPIAMTRSFNTWLPRLMFIMMPFTMLLGALFIRDKKRALLFDHLVHAAYIHAFAFFLLFAGIIASNFIAGTRIFQAIVVILLIYLPISLKRMFGRGWFKTLMTSYLVGFIYLIIITGSLVALMAWDISKTLPLA
ncbi:MAG: DUF3667 domain-containing protein [Hellea sp.]|nr:DUF3667 domain-containing protein [Hellea sp.]